MLWNPTAGIDEDGKAFHLQAPRWWRRMSLARKVSGEEGVLSPLKRDFE